MSSYCPCPSLTLHPSENRVLHTHLGYQIHPALVPQWCTVLYVGLCHSLPLHPTTWSPALSQAAANIPIYASTFMRVSQVTIGEFLGLHPESWVHRVCKFLPSFIPSLSSSFLPFIFFLNTGFLCSSSSPETCYVDQAGPRTHRNLFVSVS